MKFTFIFKHFEKIILAGALFFFVFSLLWLIEVFYTISQEKTSGIFLSANRANYKPLDNDEYNSLAQLKRNKLWLASIKRDTVQDAPDYISAFTDFMIPFKIARSNAPSAGHKLIPYISYKEGICPISKENLIFAKKTVANIESHDTDKDGIPDSTEKNHNMNPKNPQDIYSDIDNDSFSNIDEYKYNKKGISNKEIHPPLINRLILMQVSTTRIPLILKKIVRQGPSKDNWDIQINIKDANNRWTTKFLKIGNSVEVNGGKYSIINIEYTTENVLNQMLGVLEERVTSSIILRNSLNNEIIARENQQIDEPNQKIILKDLYDGKIFTTQIGGTITLGNKGTGIEKYKIINITNNNSSIEFQKKGIIFIVGKKSDYHPPT